MRSSNQHISTFFQKTGQYVRMLKEMYFVTKKHQNDLYKLADCREDLNVLMEVFEKEN